jgi:hypothetical protein
MTWSMSAASPFVGQTANKIAPNNTIRMPEILV